MRLTIESTEDLVTVDGAPCRVWKGETPGGAPCTLLVRAIELPQEATMSVHQFFARELEGAARPEILTSRPPVKAGYWL